MTRAEDVDAHFVARKRAMGASWSAIARMAGCSEMDLRRRFDATANTTLPVARPLNPREQVERVLKARGMSADHAVILARLWHANGATVSGVELARGIIGGGAAQDVCKEARRVAKDRLGLTFGPKGFALTAGDINRLNRMVAGVDDRRAAA